MTDKYIITEEQLSNIEQDAPDRVVLTCDEIRSHPYNPQADDIDEWCKLHEEVLKDIRTEAYRSGYHDGEKAEREKVLDEVCCKIRKYCQNRIWLGAERLITHIRQEGKP